MRYQVGIPKPVGAVVLNISIYFAEQAQVRVKCMCAYMSNFIWAFVCNIRSSFFSVYKFSVDFLLTRLAKTAGNLLIFASFTFISVEASVHGTNIHCSDKTIEAAEALLRMDSPSSLREDRSPGEPICLQLDKDG